MIDTAALVSTIETYKKYGWTLRRLVHADVAQAAELTKFDVPVSTGVIDAAWFSRPPQAGPIAWEARFLGSTPYALVEHLDEDSPDFDEQLRLIEQRLADVLAAKRTA